MYEFLSLSLGSRGDWLKSTSVNCIGLFGSTICISLKDVVGWASKINVVMRINGTYFRCISHLILGCLVEKRGGKRVSMLVYYSNLVYSTWT